MSPDAIRLLQVNCNGNKKVRPIWRGPFLMRVKSGWLTNKKKVFISSGHG